MEGLNRVILVGCLGRDPQLMQDRAGRPFTRLSLATERSWINDSSKKKEVRTDWHSILVWGKKGERCVQYLKTGSPVLIEGSLSHFESTGEDGKKRYQTSVHADYVKFLPGPKKSVELDEEDAFLN